jgi:iron(III) transport system permease protein
MKYRQQSFVFYTGLFVLAVTAFVPLAYMFGQLAVKFVEQPRTIASVLIDSRQAILLSRSCMVALASMSIALLLGIPTAILLASRDLPYKQFFYLLVSIPFLIPPYVMAGAWIHLLSPDGVVNTIIKSVFGQSAGLSVYNFAGCAWCMGISFFPVVALMMATGLSKIDPHLCDIARLATNKLGVWRHSVLIQILPYLLASMCLVLVFVFAQYSVPSLLGVNTYPVEIFSQFSAFYDSITAVVTSLPLVTLVILLILFQKVLMRKNDYVQITPSSDGSHGIKLGKFQVYAIAFFLIIFFVTTILPFSSVLAKTQGVSKAISTLISYGDSILITTVLAFVAAIISTALGWSIGNYLAKRNTAFAKALDIACWLPIAIPGTIIGLGIIRFSNGISFSVAFSSLAIPLIAAYVGMFCAFPIRIFEASYRRSDPNINEAAQLDCANAVQRLVHVEMPVHIGAIATSMILVFLLVVGELNATVLLIPPGQATLSVNIDNLIHYGSNFKASVLCFTEAAFVITIVGSALGLYSLSQRKR